MISYFLEDSVRKDDPNTLFYTLGPREKCLKVFFHGNSKWIKIHKVDFSTMEELFLI